MKGEIAMIQNKGSHIMSSVTCHVLFMVIAVVCVMPILLIVSISLSDNGLILASGYSFFPRGFNLEAYSYMMKYSEKLFQAYKITITVTVFGTLGSMLCSIILAYVTSRENYSYKNIISFIK